MTNDTTNAGPPTIDHVIGQKRACSQLRTALSAHYNDRMAGNIKALPHVLLVGPPGVGKSLLAGILARELGVDLHEELAQNIKSPGHIHGLLLMLEAHGCVFLDEIHELNPSAMTTLYRALEERRLFLGGDRKSLTLPPFTCIGATTDEWRLATPLLQRFRIIIRMTHYTDEELGQVIAQRAKRLGWSISDEAVTEIAKRGRNTPRLAIRNLEASRRTARAEDVDVITEQHVHKMCDVEGIDCRGLDILERRYLELLREAQGPLRLNMIATRLSLPRRTIENVIESELIRLQLVTKNESGRMLTGDGAAHLAETTD